MRKREMKSIQNQLLKLTDQLEEMRSDVEDRFEDLGDEAQVGVTGEALENEMQQMETWIDTLNDIATEEIE